jgi:hypothetical protein
MFLNQSYCLISILCLEKLPSIVIFISMEVIRLVIISITIFIVNFILIMFSWEVNYFKNFQFIIIALLNDYFDFNLTN